MPILSFEHLSQHSQRTPAPLVRLPKPSNAVLTFELSRIKEVEVILSDNNAEKINWIYKQRDEYGNWEDVLAEFDVPRSN